MLKLLRFLAWSCFGAAIAIALVGGAAYWLYNDAQDAGPLAEAKTLVIPPRSGLTAIAGQLAAGGVIRHQLTFDAIAELSGRSKSLKPGEYEFPAATPAAEALEIVAAGRTVKHRVTIPEGLTSPEVVALVAAAPALKGDAGPVPPEGSLLPETYIYNYGDSRKSLIARMEHAMKETVAEIWAKRRPDEYLAAPQDAVILASIVERETARPEERPHVAGVYVDRLRLGMRLQADPTVLFALSDSGATKLDRPLTHADLAVQSPYNTYLVKGLPPGPIDNPSPASLRAAVRPERTEDLYFVADGSGGHIFARTLADQTRNIAQYQRGEALGSEMLPPLDAPSDPVPPAFQLEHARPQFVDRAAGAALRRHVAQQTAHLRHCREGSRACSGLR